MSQLKSHSLSNHNLQTCCFFQRWMEIKEACCWSPSFLQNTIKSKFAVRWNSRNWSFTVTYMDNRVSVSHDFKESFSSLRYNSLNEKKILNRLSMINRKKVFKHFSLIHKSTHGKKRFLLCTKKLIQLQKETSFTL